MENLLKNHWFFLITFQVILGISHLDWKNKSDYQN
jgi:hypothetical protein